MYDIWCRYSSILYVWWLILSNIKWVAGIAHRHPSSVPFSSGNSTYNSFAIWYAVVFSANLICCGIQCQSDMLWYLVVLRVSLLLFVLCLCVCLSVCLSVWMSVYLCFCTLLCLIGFLFVSVIITCSIAWLSSIYLSVYLSNRQCLSVALCLTVFVSISAHHLQ